MSEKQAFVKMLLNNWQSQIKATNTLLEKLSDEQLGHEISPGRNRGIYLLGHLTAVHDMMLPLLRFEASLYPALKPVFVESPDDANAAIPPIAQLRAQWNEVNEKLHSHFNSLPADEWFTRHNNVSEEDFSKEPHRNRLSVLLSRTDHMSYHRGQIALLQKKD